MFCLLKKVYRRSTQNNEQHKMLNGKRKKKFARSETKSRQSCYEKHYVVKVSVVEILRIFASLAVSELRSHRQSERKFREKALNNSMISNINEAEASHQTSVLLFHPRSKSFVCTHSRLAHATSNFSQRVHLLHHRPQHLFFACHKAEHVFVWVRVEILLSTHTAHNMEHDSTMYSNLHSNFTTFLLIDRERSSESPEDGERSHRWLMMMYGANMSQFLSLVLNP